MKGRRIELTIKIDYLPSWSTWEGIRELIQNARDAETEYNASMDVKYIASKSTLVIQTDGVNLPHEALLLGHTTKADRTDTIGKFGEGLKLGVLALVRAGHTVKITTGEETWSPYIGDSIQFEGSKVLVFGILKRERRCTPQVRVEVSGISHDSWKEMRRSFLFLAERENDASVKTVHGTLLLAPRMKGRIHAKGIFVQIEAQLEYGYDLGGDVQIDRDRRLVARWDLDYRMRQIWEEAVVARPDLLDPLFQLLELAKRDITSFTYTAGATDYISDAMREKFVARFGQDSIPVTNLGDSRAVEHLGRKGIVVSEALANVLATKMGKIEDLKAALAQEVMERYSWSDFSPTERENLERAFSLVEREVGLDEVDVVRFRSERMMGQFKGGRIIIAKRVLESLKETLITFIHEVAHRAGGDGDRGHVDEIQAIWSEIVVKLLDESSKTLKVKSDGENN